MGGTMLERKLYMVTAIILFCVSYVGISVWAAREVDRIDKDGRA